MITETDKQNICKYCSKPIVFQDGEWQHLEFTHGVIAYFKWCGMPAITKAEPTY